MSDTTSHSHAKARIAVLIPAYNAENIIHKALDSLQQNSEPHDVIVVDDGSKVPLKDCLAPHENLIILRPEKNGGITKALNLGLRYILENGYDYVARLDADDTAEPQRLAAQRAFMDTHSDIALLGSAGRVVSETGETLFYLNHPCSHETIKRQLFYNSQFLHPSLMIRTSALKEVGDYSDAYNSAEDYELVRRIASRHRVANLPEYLINYTYSTGGISQSKRREQLISRLRIQWRYRDFTNMHFYIGLLRTSALWFLPMETITRLKKRGKNYGNTLQCAVSAAVCLAK